MKMLPSQEQLDALFAEMKAKGYWPLRELFDTPWQGSSDVWAAKMLRQWDDSEILICPAPACPLTAIGEKFLEYGQYEELFVKPGMRQELLGVLQADAAVLENRRRDAEMRRRIAERQEPETPLEPSQELINETLAKPKTHTTGHKSEVDEKKLDDEQSGCMQPIVGIGSWLGFGFLLMLLEQQQKGLGAAVLGYGVLAIIGFFTLKYLFAEGSQGVGEQTGKLVHGIVVTVVILGAIAVLGQCSGSGGDPTEMYYRR